jgi:ABC-type Fe3+-siderophore transport system permease subunit
MEVRPILLWGIVTGSALAGAVAGTVFEGVIDEYLMQPAILEKIGLAQMLGEPRFSLAKEAVSTVMAAVLGAALVSLVTFVIYTAFFSKRR